LKGCRRSGTIADAFAQEARLAGRHAAVDLLAARRGLVPRAAAAQAALMLIDAFSVEG